MRRAVLGIGLLLIAMFVFGPIEQVDVSSAESRPRTVPEDLRALQRFVDQDRPEDVIPGAEARIVFNSTSSPARTDWAMVSLHGFSACRQETAPLAERIAENLSANLFEARMTGHGQSGDALGDASSEAWLRDAREAILIGQRLGDRVLVLASSTGATLALLSAAHDHPNVAAYVFLSPNLGLRGVAGQVLSLPWARHWVPFIVGSTRTWKPRNEAEGRYWTTSYRTSALFSMAGCVRSARAAPVESIRTPVRIFYSEADATVSPKATREVFRRMTASPQRGMTPVDGAGDTHVLAGDALSPERTEPIRSAIMTWLKSLR